MLERLPFQIQGIPTLTLYEKGRGYPGLVERAPNSAPIFVSLVKDLPIDDSISDGPLDAAPALFGFFASPAIDRSISDGPLDATPSLSAMVYFVPVDRSTSEPDPLNSGPVLSAMVYFAPVDRSTSESDPLNSGPVLSAMVKNIPPLAPTMAETPPGSGNMVLTPHAGDTVTTYTFYYGNANGGPILGMVQSGPLNSYNDGGSDYWYVGTVSNFYGTSLDSNWAEATD